MCEVGEVVWDEVHHLLSDRHPFHIATSQHGSLSLAADEVEMVPCIPHPFLPS